MNCLKSLIINDPMRMKLLTAVRQLHLPECYIAAGFVRNLVWDDLHGIQTPLNDIDVIYYDQQQSIDLEFIANQLKECIPTENWQVKNQAVMHKRNNDYRYLSCLHAMSFWPEKETAVAVRLNQNNQLEIINAFPDNDMFEGKITYNPKRAFEIFEQRIKRKNWLKIWPSLKIRS